MTRRGRVRRLPRARSAVSDAASGAAAAASSGPGRFLVIILKTRSREFYRRPAPLSIEATRARRRGALLSLAVHSPPQEDRLNAPTLGAPHRGSPAEQPQEPLPRDS